MQKSDRTQTAKATHRRVQTSTTLNRKYVKRPTKKFDISRGDYTDSKTAMMTTNSQKQGRTISRFGDYTTKKVKQQVPIQPAILHPSQIIANRRMRERQRQVLQQNTIARPTAKELKDQAIQKALRAASRQTSRESSNIAQQLLARDDSTKQKRMRFGIGRIVLALSCATAAVFAIMYFVNLNMPDIQFRAAAAQLDATYPNYIPHNYAPTGISSENDLISISFENKVSGDNFVITEEKSSWDSNSLLNNFVKIEYGEDYTVIREQGLTIYVGNNMAAWVNGGTVYKLTVNKGSLSKKQIGSIAVSF